MTLLIFFFDFYASLAPGYYKAYDLKERARFIDLKNAIFQLLTLNEFTAASNEKCD